MILEKSKWETCNMDVSCFGTKLFKYEATRWRFFRDTLMNAWQLVGTFSIIHMVAYFWFLKGSLITLYVIMCNSWPFYPPNCYMGAWHWNSYWDVIKYKNEISGSFTFGWFLKLFDTPSYIRMSSINRRIIWHHWICDLSTYSAMSQECIHYKGGYLSIPEVCSSQILLFQNNT